MRERFLQALKKFHLPTDMSILLACSGGCDSVALVSLCASTQKQHGHPLVIGHVNHGLRGEEEAQKDADIVSALAQKYQLPVCFSSCHMEDWAEQGLGLEAVARQQRYRCLKQLAQKRNAVIALAHTQNDQIETVYMRLRQHYSCTGLVGISAQRDNIIRPLLQFDKQSLRQYLVQQGLSWHEDYTNEQTKFLRNKIRKDLDILEQAQPGFRHDLLHLAQECSDMQDALSALMQSLYCHEVWSQQGVTFPLDVFLQQPVLCRDRLIYRWFDKLMKDKYPADFRLPKRFVRSMRIGTGPILLRGYGIVLTKKKNMLFFCLNSALMHRT